MASTGRHTTRFMAVLAAALVALVLAAALPAFAGLARDRSDGSLSADALEALTAEQDAALLAESLETTLGGSDELALAAEPAGETFREEVAGLAMYFTVTGDGEVAVGRNNASGGTDYAIDAPRRGDVEIPETVAHGGATYRVTSVQAYAFSNGSTSGAIVAADPGDASADPVYSKVTVPASVRSVGDAAFMSCDGVSEVAFAGEPSLESVGTSAFQRCFALASFELPASVKSVGNQAFAFCTSLESFTFAEGSALESLGQGVWQCNAKFPGRLKSFVYPAVDAVRASSLAYQTSLESLTFAGSSYQYVGRDACYFCESLTYLEIPDLTGSPRETADTNGAGDVMFGSRAFADCTSLETLVFLGDAGDLVVYSANTGQQVFYDDASVTTVVYCGSPWGGTSSSAGSFDSNASLLPSAAGDVSFYNRVRFYASVDDVPAEGEGDGNPVAEVFLRNKVTPRQVNEGSLDSDMLYAFRGVEAEIPEATVAWHVEGFLADAPIASSTYAYDAVGFDFASVSISLESDSLMQKVDEMALRYTVTTHDGDLLVEGTDYEVSYFDSDGNPVASLASLDDVEFEKDREGNYESKTYTVRFTGLSPYTGSQEAKFYLLPADIDNDWYNGDISSVARLMSREFFSAGDVAAAVLVSAAAPRYILAAMPVAKALNATILVTDPDELSTGARAEIKRLDLSRVYVFGGTSIVSASVLEAAGKVTSEVKVSRIFSTATSFSRATAEVLKKADSIGVSTSQVYVVASDDAALGAAIAKSAYLKAIPVVFAAADGTLDGPTRSALKTAGYKSVTVVSESATALDRVKAQVGNDSIAYESVVGKKADLLSAMSQVSEASSSNKVDVVVAPAGDDCAAEQLLAAWYSGLKGASVLLLGEGSDDVAALKATLKPHAANISSIRFAATDGHLDKATVTDVLRVWYGEDYTGE